MSLQEDYLRLLEAIENIGRQREYNEDEDETKDDLEEDEDDED